ncbi:MAG: YhcN/YlaJ family sporulation lipoprotein [Clostridia bacterium]
MNSNKIKLQTLSAILIIVLFTMVFVQKDNPNYTFAAPTISLNVDEITTLVNSIDGIAESEAIAYGDSVVIAVRTRGVFLATQEKILKENIYKQINDSFFQYNNILILTRVKDFYTIKGLKTKIKEGANLLDVYRILLQLYPRP